MDRGTHRRTSHFNVVLILLAVGAVVLALAVLDPVAWATQYRGRDHAGHRDGNDVMARLCGDEFDGRLRGLTGYVVDWLELDATQRTAWDRVEAALADGMTTLRGLCGDMPATAAGSTAPERLAQAEAFMEAGTEAVRKLRPTFEAFYATLGEAQRASLDDALAGRGHRH